MDRWGYHCDRRLSVGTFIVFEWVSPTGDYLLSGLLRFALRAFACKSCACRRGKPVRRAKRPPDAWLFPAHPPPYHGFLSLRAQSKEPKERAPRTLRPQIPRVPSLEACLSASAAGTGASRIIGGDPVNPRPGERAHHGRCAPGFRVKQGKRERRKALRRTP